MKEMLVIVVERRRKDGLLRSLCPCCSQKRVLNCVDEETFALKPWVLELMRRTALQPWTLEADPARRDNDAIEGEVHVDSVLSCARECFISDQNDTLSKD